MEVWIFVGETLSLSLGPNHESIHWAPDSKGCWLMKGLLLVGIVVVVVVEVMLLMLVVEVLRCVRG